MKDHENKKRKNNTRRPALFVLLGFLVLTANLPSAPAFADEANDAAVAKQRAARFEQEFNRQIKPFLAKHCLRCHNAEKVTSGVRVDQLDGKLSDRYLGLWKAVLEQTSEAAMPPEDEPQPTAAEKKGAAGVG